ncbi:PREDICTED: uncharacterized protein LOC104596530 [Nelumbo nucifera]|uniref:Uncharacterized protein LOC104596530 n=1 Tax=Nelumbo nucifera TaxID=4432 RepID=A0A1U8A444_NELNU|nr:PREDICTED: uncharacterized protein LOC104596530 [Nelumbo nucifera]
MFSLSSSYGCRLLSRTTLNHDNNLGCGWRSIQISFHQWHCRFERGVQKLGSIPSSKTLAVEVLRAPQNENDAVREETARRLPTFEAEALVTLKNCFSLVHNS